MEAVLLLEPYLMVIVHVYAHQVGEEMIVVYGPVPRLKYYMIIVMVRGQYVRNVGYLAPELDVLRRGGIIVDKGLELTAMYH
tara:strand:+ start:553 stop:798 length:246 start_codon:yes stop_codon:yes gene_type:complete